jgi:hypothetical protein
LIQQGRIAAAGCILPLTLREDLPEGVGTRHRAAVGITEETDALVIVISEETGAMAGVLSGEQRELPQAADSIAETEPDGEASGEPSSPSDRAKMRWGR